MTRGATDNDTTAHLQHGEPADLRAITNCASSFRLTLERHFRLWVAAAVADSGGGADWRRRRDLLMAPMRALRDKAPTESRDGGAG